LMGNLSHHNVFGRIRTYYLLHAGRYLASAIVQPLEASENRLAYFLERFPEYRKTLRLALTHEEAGRDARSYQGWQWHDVETHPTKLIRLVTEGISRINLKTRQATSYLLRDRDSVKRVLARS
jgi:hypothetical protein